MPDQNYNTGDGTTPVGDTEDLQAEGKVKQVSLSAAPSWVTVGANHQVRIDGLDSWIKIELGSSVKDDETEDEAIKRVSKLVARNIVNEIERQAGVIVDANAKQQK